MTLWTSAGAGSSKSCTVTAAAKGDPLDSARRTLHTGAGLLTDKQKDRLEARGKELMTALIEAVSDGVPTALTELRRLGRTLKQRAGDVLAYFDRPGTSN